MIYPVGLLAIAEDIAGRIPTDEAYEGERNASWLAIAKAYLQIDHIEAAVVVLPVLTDLEAQAKFRSAAAHWSGKHPESDLARNLLRDTVNHIESFEDGLSRRGIVDLVEPVLHVLGTDAVQIMSWKLRDRFTAGNVLVTLAGHLTDPGIRRETLRSAEELAKGVCPGDRDYALRWVISGYRSAGLEEDERRARALMSRDLELMNESEASLMAAAKQALEPLTPPDADSLLLRLRRFVDYGYNDLRVLFLTECFEAGGLDDPEAEQLISEAAFRRIAPPHPPSIYSDPTNFDLEALSRSLFGRPKRQQDSDRDFIDGTGYLEVADWRRFVNTLRDLFINFGDIAPRFSPEQVDQGLWYLLGEPFWLSDHLASETIPAPEITALTHAMYCPFRDYYLRMADPYPGSAFFMWWDSFSSLGHHPAASDATFDVLRQILVLPHKACRDAALHGLNHLYPEPRAATIIEDYLDRNRETMSKDEIDWAEACKAGMAR